MTRVPPPDQWADSLLAGYGQFLTVNDVAAVLVIDARMVRRLLTLPDSSRRLPGAKFGGSWRIAKSDLRQYMLESHNGSTFGRPDLGLSE